MTGGPRPVQAPPATATVAVLGLTQILAWGATYYLPAVLARPIAADTGWPLTWIVGALSLGTLVSGLCAPFVGRRIDRDGGRPVLLASALAFAVGLAIVASARHLAVYVAGWWVLGIGMSAGLYDAAFGTLAKLYGQDARRRIATLTLYGGFASTVCWPLTAWLEARFGWRGACASYAALHLLVVGPVYFLWVPRAAPASAAQPSAAATAAPAAASLEAAAVASADAPPVPWLPFLLLAASGALASAIGGVVAVHLLTILQGRGLALVAAVALGTLVGPSQVGARLLEVLFGQALHPLWLLLVSTALVFGGTGLLLAGAAPAALALVLYGAGIGVHSIARGTVPLALFGAERYASVMGRLARPGAIVGALAPTVGAMLWSSRGVQALLLALVLAAAANLACALGMLAWHRRTA